MDDQGEAEESEENAVGGDAGTVLVDAEFGGAEG